VNKKEEQRLRDEIDYWSKYEELDKFNYDVITSNLLEIIAITISVILGLSAIIIQIQTKTFLLFLIKSTLILVTVLIFIVIIDKRYKEYKQSRSNYSHNIITRDEMIEEKYSKLYGLQKGQFKEKLDREFIPIKERLDNENQ
jgi:hypothetical protein